MFNFYVLVNYISQTLNILNIFNSVTYNLLVTINEVNKNSISNKNLYFK